jgi:hypothetical protein
VPAAATTAAGRFFRLSLQAGDTGVKSVDGINFSTAWTSGLINLIAYRVLTVLENGQIGSSAAVDALTASFPRIFDGTVPFILVIPSGTAAAFISGHYIETQG